MQTVYHAEAKLQTYRTKDLVMTLLTYAVQTHRTKRFVCHANLFARISEAANLQNERPSYDLTDLSCPINPQNN